MTRMTAMAAGLAAALALGQAWAKDMSFGEAEFQARCAACHGMGGQGDGPVAGLMERAPRDLTLLAKENGGQFPFSETYQAIDGRREIVGHGTAEMPIWGDYFTAAAAPLAGRPNVSPEQVVQGRILSLVYYIQTIQRP